jgi:hypothetical protein
MFGTLYVPQKEREPLIFGVAEHAEGHIPQARADGSVVKPAGHFKPLLPKRPADVAPTPLAERDRA